MQAAGAVQVLLECLIQIQKRLGVKMHIILKHFSSLSTPPNRYPTAVVNGEKNTYRWKIFAEL